MHPLHTRKELCQFAIYIPDHARKLWGQVFALVFIFIVPPLYPHLIVNVFDALLRL